MTTKTSARYSIGSEKITYSAQAPAEIAGKTATVWFAKDRMDGRKIMSGFRSRAAIVAAVAEREALEALTTVQFADGTVKVMPEGVRAKLLGLDADGDVVICSDGINFVLTPCCYADGTYSGDVLCCRRCYDEVPFKFGDIAVGPFTQALA